MTLRDDIEQWRGNVVRLQEGMEEIRYLSNRVPECPLSELGSLLSQVSELCQESLTQVEYLRDELAKIQWSWGCTIVKSIGGCITVKQLPVKYVKDWDKWTRGLQDKIPKKENYSKSMKTILNTWKGDKWGYFIEQQLSFEEWHLEGKMWANEDIDSPYLLSVITRAKERRIAEQKHDDKTMLKITNSQGSAEYDGVRRKEYLDPSLAKDAVEFKLRNTAYKAKQARVQAEDLAIESSKQGKPSRMTYYFYQQPSDKEVNSIMKIYKAAMKRYPGARIDVEILLAENEELFVEDKKQKNT